jgi:nucleotide-binding universal stress UspA family protein
MKHKLLIVLEDSPTTAAVMDYVAAACADSPPADGQLVLFTMLPALPAWVEAGDSTAAALQRDRLEADGVEHATRRFAEARRQLVAHGIPADCLREELVDESPQRADEVRRAAKRHGCDTIVMARHHQSLLREWLAGDPQEKLLHHPSEFTVWLVA